MNPWVGWSKPRTLIPEALLYATASISLTQKYSREINAFDAQALRFVTQQQIVDGEALDPYRFRLLVPEVVHWLGLHGPFGSSAVSLDRIHFVLFGSCFFLLFWLLRVQLTQLGWSAGQSLVGPLVIALILPMALINHDYQPWSWVEAVSIPLVVILVLRRNSVWWLVVVGTLAVLNRETALALVLIPMAMLLMNRKSRGHRKYFVLAGLALALPWIIARYLMLFVWPGPANERVISVAEVWARNTDFSSAASLQWGGWLTMIFTVGVFAAAVVVASLFGIANRSCPREALWIAALTVPAYVAGWGVFALWGEVRVLVPVMLLLIPIALSAFASPDQRPPVDDR